MPRITDARKAMRRMQILQAAWSCFDREGLHATSMETIIRKSGLSAGAVYGYFASKEALTLAALGASLVALTQVLHPVLEADPPAAPPVFVRTVVEIILRFSARDGYDMRRIALHGWSETQRNEALRASVGAFYRSLRSRIARVAVKWRKAGMIGAKAKPEEMAEMIFSVILGFVVQSTVMGDAAPLSHERAFAALQMFQPHGERIKVTPVPTRRRKKD